MASRNRLQRSHGGDIVAIRKSGFD